MDREQRLNILRYRPNRPKKVEDRQRLDLVFAPIPVPEIKFAPRIEQPVPEIRMPFSWRHILKYAGAGVAGLVVFEGIIRITQAELSDELRMQLSAASYVIPSIGWYISDLIRGKINSRGKIQNA